MLALVAIIAITACEKEGDLITLSQPDEGTMLASVSSVVLTQENSGKVTLGLSWTTTELTVSDPNMSAPDVLTHTLQASVTSDFSSNVVETNETSLSKSYSGADLNALAKTLEITPDVATMVYFRMVYSTGNNIDPVYSNTVKVNVTSYEIDMTMGVILTKEQDDSGIRLYSAEADGKYTGFMGATAWYNFFLQEGDGTIWGNDEITEIPFILSSETTWNCWFPGMGGCYYVDFNTINKTWAGLYIPTLTVEGDISGEMSFDRPNNTWYLPFTATSTSMTIQISGTGKQYNNVTGTDDDAAIDTPVAFALNDQTVEFTETTTDFTLSVPEAGDYTLNIDLSDPTNWIIEASTGSDIPEEVIETLYLPGVDDLISGAWTFDNELSLYDEENLAYSGVVLSYSEWGYAIHTEKDNWDDKYTMASGDAISGTLEYQGATNIAAPDSGLYLFEVSLSELTYNLYSVGNEIYLSGLNDVWDFANTLAATSKVGEYSGQITITSVTEWGFKILLNTEEDDSGTWEHFYGGSDGNLYYKGSNITDDATLGVGTYTMTVNLIDGTYSITN